MTFWKWSKTAASNSNADSTINWAEGQAPSSVNDSARALMAAAAKERDDTSGMLDTGGTATAYTVTSNQNLTALTDGFKISLRMHVASGASPTLTVDLLAAKAIRAYDVTVIPPGALALGGIYDFTYDSGQDCWFVHNLFTITTALTGIDLIGGTQLTAPAIDDTLLIYDLSATANKRILTSDFYKTLGLITAEPSIAIDDLFPLFDTSAAVAKAMTPVNMLKILNLLTEDASPDNANDFLLSFDTSAGTVKKVKPQNTTPLQGGPVTHIISGTLSSQAVLDIALGTADMYEIDLINLIPASDGVLFSARFSQSGAFLGGASDYDWGYHTFSARVTSAANNSMEMANTWGNQAAETGTITVRVFRPSVAGFRKPMHHHGLFHSTAGEPLHTVGGGGLIANTNAIDGIRFFFSAGNIASGFYAVRSYRFS